MQKVTLKDAVILTGRNYTTIFRAVKNKKLPQHYENGKRYVFANELFALFPNKTGTTNQKTEQAIHRQMDHNAYLERQSQTVTALQERIKHLETEKKHLLSLIDTLKNTQTLLKNECDDLKDQRQQVMQWVRNLQENEHRLTALETENRLLKQTREYGYPESVASQSADHSRQKSNSFWKRLVSYFKTVS